MEKFITQCAAAIANSTFVKCTLSRPSATAPQGLKAIYLRPVEVKKQFKIAFNYRFATKDEVKNHSPEAAIGLLTELLGTTFLNADLFTTERDYTLSFDKKGVAHLQTKAPAQTEKASLQHDRSKQRLLDPQSPWLHHLGITNAKGEVLAHAQDKWRQINKFLEIIAALVREHPLQHKPQIADMGSGKGYLTFALYDFLAHQLHLNPWVTGIELRPNLVELCNDSTYVFLPCLSCSPSSPWPTSSSRT